MKFTPRRTARCNTLTAVATSGGSPQTPRPVMRMAPKPRRLTSRSAPRTSCPAAAAFMLAFIDTSARPASKPHASTAAGACRGSGASGSVYRFGCELQILRQRLRRPDLQPLDVIDRECFELAAHVRVLDALGNRRDSHGLAQRVDRLDHGSRDRIVLHVADELAVDLQVIDGQLLQVHERGHAAAEIIERERTAEPTQ